MATCTAALLIAACSIAASVGSMFVFSNIDCTFDQTFRRMFDRTLGSTVDRIFDRMFDRTFDKTFVGTFDGVFAASASSLVALSSIDCAKVENHCP